MRGSPIVMSAPVLSIDEVHAVLERAIVDARLADPAKAGEFAILLVQSVADGVNQIVEAKTSRVEAVQVAQVATGDELMSMGEALGIRNRVAAAMQVDPVSGSWAATAAERLLMLGYIDVAEVRVTPDPDDSDLVSRPVSEAVKVQVMGAVSERTGMIPTITPSAATPSTGSSPTT